MPMIPHFMVGACDLIQVNTTTLSTSQPIWLTVHEGVRKAPALQTPLRYDIFDASPLRASKARRPGFIRRKPALSQFGGATGEPP
nr:hypothetical protein [uncultured Brevundimonas sp.]